MKKWTCFYLPLFLVPWITYRESRTSSDEAVNAQGVLFYFLVIMAQGAPLWAVKRKDQGCPETLLAIPFFFLPWSFFFIVSKAATVHLWQHCIKRGDTQRWA